MGSKSPAMFSHLSGGFGLSNRVLLEYFHTVGVLWSCSTQKMHRSLSFVCSFSSACTGMAKRAWPLLLDWVISWHECVQTYEEVLLGRKDRKFVFFGHVCHVGCWLGHKRIPHFWGAVGMEGHIPLATKDSSANSCQLEQQHQKHMENVGICAM